MTSAHRIRIYARALRAKRVAIWAMAALACVACLPGSLYGQGAWTGNTNVTYVSPPTKVAIGTQVPFLNFQVQGDPASGWPVATLLSNSDFVFGSTGSALYSGLGAASGNTYSVIQAFTNGIYPSSVFSPGSLIFNRNGGNVGIGTTGPPYLLSVKGAIGAQEVNVVNTASWPDYVFEPTYRLQPLNEVAAYVKVHHHLPEIPSEAEVKEKGISLGDMQARLLAKIEELTLHLIQSDEKNRELQDRIARLESGRPPGTVAGPAGKETERP
jgi:hypothetical protein